MKNTLLLFAFLFVQISFGQKDFSKVETRANLMYSSFSFTINHEFFCFKGKPKKLEFEGTTYYNPGFFLHEEYDYRDRSFVPSTRFYLEPSDLVPHPKSSSDKGKKESLIKGSFALEEEFIDDLHQVYILPREKIERIYRPFYFKKFEVTNKEYWEFIESVGETTEQGTYYKDLTYTLVENGKTLQVPIYPDTTCWVRDAKFSVNEPFTRQYFSYSDFEHYPIVGINYYQAKAFCHWKTIQLKNGLSKKNKHLKIKVDLPSAIEWDWMSIASKEKDHMDILILSDNDWMLDLVMDFENISIKNFNNELFSSIYYEGNFPVDGSFYSFPSNLEDKKLHKKIFKGKNKGYKYPDYLKSLDHNNISGMGNNVSEWLRDTYADNWQLMFQRQIKLWEQENTPASLLLRQIALFHDSRADKDGHLVKGGNWIDERFSNVKGKNKAGIHAKTFISPHKSHSTLGFRYVVYFTE